MTVYDRWFTKWAKKAVTLAGANPVSLKGQNTAKWCKLKAGTCNKTGGNNETLTMTQLWVSPGQFKVLSVHMDPRVSVFTCLLSLKYCLKVLRGLEPKTWLFCFNECWLLKWPSRFRNVIPHYFPYLLRGRSPCALLNTHLVGPGGLSPWQ